MAFLYLDDSKHHKCRFLLAAFTIFETDPTDEASSIFRKHGFDPTSFEFKSSAKMKDNGQLQVLRSALRQFIVRNGKTAICVVDGDKRLGPAALRLLEAALKHPLLNETQHDVYFDEGLFSSVGSANTLVKNNKRLETCRLHFEQNSRDVQGIQLSDLIAHTCGTMLLDAPDERSKMVTINEPGDSIYHDMEVELGFEMWASIRHTLLGRNKQRAIVKSGVWAVLTRRPDLVLMA